MSFKQGFRDAIEKKREIQGQPRQNVGESREAFSQMINDLISRADTQQGQPRLTAEDLFGEQINRLGDSTRAAGNATKQAIARAMMARGGDPSGAAGANLLGVDQQVAGQLGQQGLQFAGLAEQANRFGQGRADQMTGMSLQGLQSLFGMDQSILSDQIMQQQAERQRRADMLGNIFGLGGLLIPELVNRPTGSD